jgi:hypothetical protein
MLRSRISSPLSRRVALAESILLYSTDRVSGGLASSISDVESACHPSAFDRIGKEM